MRKIKNEIEYSLKGQLQQFENGVATAVIDGKTPKIDSIDIAEMNQELNKFWSSAMNRNLEFKLVARIIDEGNEEVESETEDDE